MGPLESLQREYDETTKRLAHPLDLADFQQLKDRRQVVLQEAELLAKTLNLSGPQWFSVAI